MTQLLFWDEFSIHANVLKNVHICISEINFLSTSKAMFVLSLRMLAGLLRALADELKSRGVCNSSEPEQPYQTHRQRDGSTVAVTYIDTQTLR